MPPTEPLARREQRFHERNARPGIKATPSLAEASARATRAISIGRSAADDANFSDAAFDGPWRLQLEDHAA